MLLQRSGRQGNAEQKNTVQNTSRTLEVEMTKASCRATAAEAGRQAPTERWRIVRPCGLRSLFMVLRVFNTSGLWIPADEEANNIEKHPFWRFYSRLPPCDPRSQISVACIRVFHLEGERTCNLSSDCLYKPVLVLFRTPPLEELELASKFK